MSFQSLKVEELKDVADFFAVDVEVADEEHGATKKELLAALAAGDNPVTWDDYKDAYLVDKNAAPSSNDAGTEDEESDDEETTEEPVVDDDAEHVLVKYNRKNPSFQIVGYTFTRKHPFKSVPVEVAEYLVRNVSGFSLALPSEVKDYYN